MEITRKKSYRFPFLDNEDGCNEYWVCVFGGAVGGSRDSDWERGRGERQREITVMRCQGG